MLVIELVSGRNKQQQKKGKTMNRLRNLEWVVWLLIVHVVVGVPFLIALYYLLPLITG